MNRALIACGGTGGHLSPGIALAQELINRGWQCRLLISSKKVDARLVKKYKEIEYDTIPGSGLSFRPLALFRFVRDFVKGYRVCSRKVEAYKPDALVGFGGFISAPSLLAGSRKGVKVAIHEANRVPGRATRLTSHIANRIYLPKGVSLSGKRADRVLHAGIPLRTEIAPTDKRAARQSLGLEESRKTLLVFGGSQGARSLTNWSIENASRLRQKGIQLICLKGLSDASEQVEREGENARGPLARFFDFSDDMPTLLSAADLVVSRAGAGSIAEIARCGVPAILIPYPFAADDHQTRNAEEFENQGGGMLLPDQRIGELFTIVEQLIGDDSQLDGMKKRLQLIDAGNSSSDIANDLEALISECQSGRLGSADGEKALR